MTDDRDLIRDVCRLVLDHLAPHFYAETGASRRAVRHLLRRLGELPLDLLVRLGRADSFGRTTEDARRREYPQGEWLLERASLVGPQDDPPAEVPLVQGRHLLQLGYPPGPAMGQVLLRLFEAQLAGRFHTIEDGLVWLKTQG
jgi:tRNA nucleotidyltransferase (CCA-adding enzyme)